MSAQGRVAGAEYRPLPRLVATAMALAAYDAAVQAFMARTDFTAAEAEQAERELEKLAEDVGARYGEETADRNNPETCRQCIRPGPAEPPPGQELSFVRRMVALSLAG